MLQTIKKNILSLFAGLVLATSGGLVLAPVAMAQTTPNEVSDQICAGVTSATGGTCDSKASATTVNTLVNTIINILSWFIGVIAVIMIIYGGFRFVTSTGDSAKLTAARQTIIYALVGLVIVVLAQTVVKFVLSKFA